MASVLLIGGRSFIGGHVCRSLIARGHHVLLHSTSTGNFENLSDVLPHPLVEPVKCSSSSDQDMEALIARAQYVVFSSPPPGKQSLGKRADKERDLENVKRMLELLKASTVKKSVFISTCSTIGKVKDGLADETHVAGLTQGWEAIAYKVRMEQLVLDYANAGLAVVVVNPTMFIGEWDTKPSSGEFFKFIVHAPFVFLKGCKINILSMEDAGMGVVLALEKGRGGQRYILGGENILNEELIARIKKCAGQKMPWFAMPYSFSVIAAYASELVNCILRQDKPLIPLIGIELTAHGTQHFSIEKAKRELGYQPGDAWAAVDKAYAWYKAHGMLE